RQALAPDDADAVTREGVGVRGGLVDLAEAARGEHDRLALEDVQLTGRQLVGDDAGGLLHTVDLGHHEVERVELVEEVHAELDAVLEERLKDHVAGAVGRVAGATDRRLAVVARVTAEPALVDAALGRAVEGQAHVLEVEDRVDRLLGEDLGRVLVDEVVAALDGVEGVPLPGVLFGVRERRGHAALRRTRVGTRGVELGDDRGVGARCRLDRGAHPGTPRPHDDDVVPVVMHAVDDVAVFELQVLAHVLSHYWPRGYWAAQIAISSALSVGPRQGSKVVSTSVPSTSSTTVVMPSAHSSTLRKRPCA